MAELLIGFGVEWYKLRRRPLPWVLLGVMLLFVLLSNIAFLLLTAIPATSPELAAAATALGQLVYPPNSLYVTLASVHQIGSLLAIILGAVAGGSEQQWGTLRALLIRQPRRALYLGSLLLCLVTSLLLGLVAIVTTGLLLSLVVTSLSGQPIAWTAVGSALIGPSFALAALRTYLTLIVYLLFGLAVTSLARSVPVGLGLGLTYYVFDALLATSTLNMLRPQLEMLPGLGPLIHWGSLLLLGYNLTLINSASGAELQLSGAAAGAIEPIAIPVSALLVVTVYAMLFLALPFVALRRRDLTG